MKLLAYFHSLTARFFHRSQTENDMDEELRLHIEHRADDLERSGLERNEAERRARIEFGSHERFKEECREALGGNFIDTLMQDVRFSFRMLGKSPRCFTRCHTRTRMKLVLLAYPDSADANDNFADAYLRDGQKDLARQHAEKALALLDSHSAPASSWADTEPQRGEIRRSAEKILKKLGEKQR